MTGAPPAPPPDPSRVVVGVLYAGFVLTGTANVVLGPLIPRLHADTGVPLETLGWLVLVQFTAHSLGAILSSVDVRRSLTLGYPLVALGLAGIRIGWPGALAAIALVGLGLGLVIPATNVLIARWNPTRQAAALSRLNMLWGAGALSSPLLFAGLARLGAVRLAPVVLALSFGVLAALLVGRLPSLAAPPVAAGAGRPSLPLLALFALQLFLYAGAELTVGNWSIVLGGPYTAARPGMADLLGTSFYGALLVGRAVAPRLLHDRSSNVVYVGALIGAVAGCALMFAAHALTPLWIGVVIVGVACAPVFPILAAELVDYTHRVRPSAAGPVFAVCGFGAGALPWLAGYVAAAAGGLRGAVLVPLGAFILLVLLSFARARPS
jgi:FHS family glucose/mannose:H+ symporter-like MFS transporter